MKKLMVSAGDYFRRVVVVLMLVVIMALVGLHDPVTVISSLRVPQAW